MKYLKAIGELLLGAIGGLAAIALVGGFLFLGAIGSVALGWLAGVFANWVFGGMVISGINLLVGTALIKANLPVITAAIGLIAYICRGGTKNFPKIGAKKEKSNVEA